MRNCAIPSVLVFDGLWRKYTLCTDGGEVGVEDTSLLADSGRNPQMILVVRGGRWVRVLQLGLEAGWDLWSGGRRLGRGPDRGPGDSYLGAGTLWFRANSTSGPYS